jgi:3-methyl-2-oxobutanoate hydroxymethyltransferase
MADMPFGSYHGSTGDAVDNVCRMVRQTGCDSVKLEATPRHLNLVQALNDAGVAVCVHLGLRPQSVQTIGYRVQAKSDEAINELIDLARDFQMNGASMILLEAVPPEASQQLCHEVDLPVIGCGAGPAPTAYVVVLQDLLGLTDRRPKFVPDLGVLPLPEAAKQWVEMVHSGRYPAAEHLYDAGRA